MIPDCSYSGTAANVKDCGKSSPHNIFGLKRQLFSSAAQKRRSPIKIKDAIMELKAQVKVGKT